MRRTRIGVALLGTALLLSGCAADATEGAQPGGTKSPPIADETPGAVEPGAATDAGVTPAETSTGAAVAAEGSSVLAVVADDPQFSTFVQVVEAAGLEQTLGLPGPLTVFAPTNEAFASLPPGLLQQLLKPKNKEPLTFIAAYHVVEDEITAGDLDGDVTALSGQTLTLSSSDGGTVNGVAIVQPDVSAGNGVVHGIDGVLIPPDVDPQALLPQ
jgi:uncharacterized surface protein with fasciclin (FAS1) repeats